MYDELPCAAVGLGRRYVQRSAVRPDRDHDARERSVLSVLCQHRRRGLVEQAAMGVSALRAKKKSNDASNVYGWAEDGTRMYAALPCGLSATPEASRHSSHASPTDAVGPLEGALPLSRSSNSCPKPSRYGLLSALSGAVEV